MKKVAVLPEFDATDMVWRIPTALKNWIRPGMPLVWMIEVCHRNGYDIDLVTGQNEVRFNKKAV